MVEKKRTKKSALYFNKLLNKANAKSIERIVCPICKGPTSGKQLLRHLYFKHQVDFRHQKINKKYSEQIKEFEKELDLERQRHMEQDLIDQYGSLEEAERAKHRERLKREEQDKRNAAQGVLDPESTKSPPSDVTWATKKR